MKKQDILWKGVLEELFTDFICFMHPDTALVLDTNRGYVFLDKELEQVFTPDEELYTTKIADKLVKMYTIDGAEEWVPLHIEIQGQYKKDFGKRMFTYFYCILDRYDKRISAYAIFTEAGGKPRPDIFSLSFMGTQLSYQFNSYKIFSQPREELLKSNNPFAIVVLAARAAYPDRHLKSIRERDDHLMETKINLVKHLFRKKFSEKQVAAVLKFINYYVNFELKETSDTFVRKLNVLNKNKSTMGLDEQIMIIHEMIGMKKGVRKGRRLEKRELQTDLVQNLMVNHGYSTELTAELMKVSLPFVKRVMKMN